LISGPPSKFVLVWDVEKHKIVRYLGNGTEPAVTSAVVSPNGRLVLTIDGPRGVVWDVANGEQVGRLEGIWSFSGATFQGTNILTIDGLSVLKVWPLPETPEGS
jgi:hypothetical protein